jgi:hypothetical protein
LPVLQNLQIGEMQRVAAKYVCCARQSAQIHGALDEGADEDGAAAAFGSWC